jgi:hypothetical protein
MQAYQRMLRVQAIDRELATELNYQEEIAAVRTMWMIVGTFLLCWMPAIIFSFVKYFWLNEKDFENFKNFCLYFLPMLNAALDPVIYALGIKEIRRETKAMFFNCCCWWRRRNYRENES